MRVIPILVMLMWAAPAGAAEDPYTGNWALNGFCSDPDKPGVGISLYGQGFINGVTAGLLRSDGTFAEPAFAPHCLPNGITPTQIGRVICHYLKDHPAETHQSLFLLVADAFAKAWPCKG